MKLISSLFLLLLIISCSTMHLNDWENRQDMQSDSLRVLDSIRVADSVKTSDSLLLSRYDKSETILLENAKERTARSAALRAYTEAEAADSNQPDSSVSSAREVVIDENSAQAKIIDSLQLQIDSLENVMYNTDNYFAKMKDYTFQDKKAYLKYLIKNHLRDTVQVVTFCECFHSQLKTEHKKLLVIMGTQDGDTKGIINLHVRKTKIEMGEIGKLIYTFSSKVPSKIEYNTNDKNIFKKSE